MSAGTSATPKWYRVYGDGREFGLDYPNLAEARRVKELYAAEWPRTRYYIRAVNGLRPPKPHSTTTSAPKRGA